MPNAETDLDIDRFLANPSEYFGNRQARMLGLDRREFDALQLAGLKRRFGQFRGALPMLDKLADSQGIDKVEQLDDVLPLLFDHAVYKSYPASLLDKQRFGQLTAWLNKLTTIDLSGIDASACRGIDDWMMLLEKQTPLAICHTSGTTGTMSFLPWSKQEWRKVLMQYPVLFFQHFDDDAPAAPMPLDIECIYPFFRSGGMSHTVVNDAVVELIAGDESRFHVAYPQRLSADLLLLGARHRVAAAKGQLDQLQVSPELAARRAEFETQQRDMPLHLNNFFTNIQTRLAGKRVFMMATSSLLFTLAESGLKQGLRRIFSPDSVIFTGGGGKGIVLPPDWKQTLKDFFGADNLFENYGMSEMAGVLVGCEQGHFHCVPWIIPYLLDPETAQPLPRAGNVTGRFAYYDLMTDTRWGGFVTGDEVTMHWDEPCACGRTTPWLGGTIQRINEKKGDGDEKLSCAAAPDAYADALDFLNDFTV